MPDPLKYGMIRRRSNKSIYIYIYREREITILENQTSKRAGSGAHLENQSSKRAGSGANPENFSLSQGPKLQGPRPEAKAPHPQTFVSEKKRPKNYIFPYNISFKTGLQQEVLMVGTRCTKKTCVGRNSHTCWGVGEKPLWVG